MSNKTLFVGVIDEGTIYSYHSIRDNEKHKENVVQVIAQQLFLNGRARRCLSMKQRLIVTFYVESGIPLSEDMQDHDLKWIHGFNDIFIGKITVDNIYNAEDVLEMIYHNVEPNLYLVTGSNESHGFFLPNPEIGLLPSEISMLTCLVLQLNMFNYGYVM